MTELKQEQDLLEGVEMKIGRKTFTIPPLNFLLLKKHQDDIENFINTKGSNLKSEKLDILTKIILGAINRNYPDVTLHYLEENLHMGLGLDIFHSILMGSGVKLSQAKLGEALAPISE